MLNGTSYFGQGAIQEIVNEIKNRHFKKVLVTSTPDLFEFKVATKVTDLLDAAGIALNTYVRGVSLYQTQSNPVWDEALLKGRLRFSNPVLIAKSGDSDLRRVMREMKTGLPFYYLPDMDHGRRNSIFVPFFGVEAATLPMVSRLARVMQAKVLWCIATMTETGYQVEISEAWENFPTNDPHADTCRLNAELETFIRQQPDQYLWVHRRFKTRPEGEHSLY